jgi:hypothetical protein
MGETPRHDILETLRKLGRPTFGGANRQRTMLYARKRPQFFGLSARTLRAAGKTRISRKMLFFESQ